MSARVPSILNCDKVLLNTNNQPFVAQLLQDLERLSEDTESSDIIFILGKEEERVFAHRIILMARCKSFQTTKRGEICRIPGSIVSNTNGPHHTIRLSHINADIFRQFLQFVYTAKILLQDSRVFEMMALAQDMGIEELKLACEDHVISTLSAANACAFLASILEIQEKAAGAAASFMERCITYIGENAAECVKTNAFLNLTKEALIKLISSDYFCLEEEDVWRCVLAWAKHQAGVTQPTAFWTEEERLRVCQFLAPVIGYVRLLLIDSSVFAEEVEPTGAVPMELSLERYRFAALQSSHNKLPATGNHSPFNENDQRFRPRLLTNLFPGSAILKNDKIHLQAALNKWYGAPKQVWKLVYRASTHGFSATSFHQRCDGVAPVFVVALGTRGEISGGFSDVAWARTNRKGGYIHSERAFLFALNYANEPPIKFDVVKKLYAICYHPESGPIFGAGADLLISSQCNVNMDSYSNLPHSYDCPKSPGASCMSLFGDYNFSLVDYEIWTLGSSSVGPKIKHDRYVA